MKTFGFLAAALCPLILFSCSSSNVLEESECKLATPYETLELSADNTFAPSLMEVSGAHRVQIVCDSIMVIEEKTPNAGDFIYKAYSLNSWEFLGGFVRKGRGPGELLTPHLVRGHSDGQFLNLNDNGEGYAYSIDVPESIRTGGAVFADKRSLPSGIVDYTPVSESVQFSLVLKDGELFYQVSQSGGDVISEFHPYRDIDGNTYVTRLSQIFLHTETENKVTSIMLDFPQINIFDIAKGVVYSTAVNKEYLNWRSILNHPIDLNPVQYYVGAAASKEYIFASYVACPLENIIKGDYSTSIHIFDWDGNWLYNVSVNEKIEAMTYDSEDHYLYAIDKVEDRLVRYDFRDLL